MRLTNEPAFDIAEACVTWRQELIVILVVLALCEWFVVGRESGVHDLVVLEKTRSSFHLALDTNSESRSRHVDAWDSV